LPNTLCLRLGHVVRQGGLPRVGHFVGEPERHAVRLVVVGGFKLCVLREVKNPTAQVVVAACVTPVPPQLLGIPPGGGVHHVTMAKH